MAPGTGRQFKHVFEEAQHQLRTVFGMQMVELPQKEKISISQKRGASPPPSNLSFCIPTLLLPRLNLEKPVPKRVIANSDPVSRFA